MSVPVHRCRFVQWSPSPITALAVPPHGSEFPPLAVGRQNGSIELYRWASTGPSPHAWVLQATLPGPADTKVDALAFTVRARRHPGQSRLRLFSLAGDANLFEWDIHSGSLRVRITPSTPQFTYVPPLSLYVPSPPILLIQSAISIVTNLNPAFSQHTIPSQGGTIWSLAPNPQGTLLALGCQDGAIRLLDISAETPVHLKRFDRVQTRFLSIAWAWPDPSLDAPDDSDDESDLVLDTTLVTGCSDSCVRTWDVRTGRVLNRMTVERARGERTLVWSVAVLGDGTIVSGDSLGAVKFWDNKTATQIQSSPAHNADVLCMTVSPTGDTVYTSGVDQRITEFVKLADKWIQTTQRRIHSHDVRALAMWPPYAPHNPTKPAYAPLLISAGLDMSVAILPTAPAHAESSSTLPNPLLGSNAPTFQDAYPRRVGYPVTSGPTFLAPIAKLVVSFHGRVVGVCKLPDEPTEGGEWEKLLEMELRFRTNITTGAISPDGKWLAVADVYEVKLFRIEDVKGRLHPRRSRTIASVLPPNSGASALGFTPDSRRLIVGTWSGAQVVLVDLDQGREEIVRTFELDNVERENDLDLDKNEDVTSGDPRVSRVAVSSDSQWLASADSAGRVNIFNLDSVKHVASLPRTGLPPSALVFDTHVPHVLALGYPSNNIQLFDAEAQAFYPALPDKLSHLHDPILGFAFPPTTSSTQRKLYVWSASYLARFDIATPSTSALVKSPPKAPTHRNEDGLKRKRGEQDDAFAIVTKFRPVLLVDFCASGEMVVVERPLVDLLATLPPAYLKPKYGAS